MNSKLDYLKLNFNNTLSKIDLLLKQPKTEFIFDAGLLRFKHSVDLSGKLLKAFLEEKYGVKVASPKETFREAYRQGVIEYDEDWLTFVDMRNESSHTYDEQLSEKIYNELPDVLAKLEEIKRKID